ncbi:nitroreductase family protein [Kibdelosporangium phytohabitans]|uniref:Nitroreductase n=1 Tax=Kibdelosporangium phytohabitans TaxID=860235 RepID=A0A0N7F4H7_9PSEU|nr:nitroreductase family protein [Kibdelosporangium phytohabitans]ALG11463.1 nitroreductase [Kibdelosporangium phytohabitans]MBE1462809.1 nitroreductase [Kibdelosporangium phytohabitans]
MEFAEVIRRRRMVRHFTDQPLAPEVVEKILGSALRAPSAGFSQGWAFLALTAPADRARFWQFAPGVPEHWPSTRDVPLIVIPLAHKQAYLDRYAEDDKGWEDRAEARWPAPYWYIDTGMASLMMLLSAVDEGLGALFFGIEPKHLDGVKTEYGIPGEYAPLGAILIGYRAEDVPVIGSAATRTRRGAAEVIHHGQWGNLTKPE